MAKYDFSKALKPQVNVSIRNQCETYEGIYSYFKTRVAEMQKAKNYSAWVHHQNPKDTSSQVVVSVNIFSMPLYWHMTPTGGKDRVIKNPDGTVRITMPDMYGHTDYPVDTIEDGIAMLHELADNEDENFKKILTNASEALDSVRNYELPHINEHAENAYNASKWVAEFGKWDEKDEKTENGERYSKKKTNKMNTFKQTSRRQLGYGRTKDKVYVQQS